MFEKERTAAPAVRKRFPEGSRVRLVSMDDARAPAPGTLGTVRHVDDVATVHVDWDDGPVLGAVWGTDSVEPA